MMERVTTKVTRLNANLWGCRVYYDGTFIVEGRVDDRSKIGGCFHCLLRTLDKLGYDSPMCSATRHRQSASNYPVKHLWNNERKK